MNFSLSNTPRVRFENFQSNSTSSASSTSINQNNNNNETDQSKNLNQLKSWSMRFTSFKKLSVIIYQILSSNNSHHDFINQIKNKNLIKLDDLNQSIKFDQNLGHLIEKIEFLKFFNDFNEKFSKIELKLFERLINLNLNLQEDFIILKNLSSSKTGSVDLVKTNLSNLHNLNQSNLYILKTIPKLMALKMSQNLSIKSELSIFLLSQSHPSSPIPKLFASFQSQFDLHLLIQFIPSGTLEDYAINNPSPNHSILRFWSAQIILALDWLHKDHRWCHRDLKPSNLLIDKSGHVLLNDFGTAAPLEVLHGPRIDNYLTRKFNKTVHYDHDTLSVPPQYRTVLVGTCDYIAPEVLDVHLCHTIVQLDSLSDDELEICQNSQKENISKQLDEYYGFEVDFWSFGISLYELIYGQPAFFCQSIGDTYDRIVSHQDYLQVSSTSQWAGCEKVKVSHELQNFIKSLICSRDVRIGCGKDGIEQIKRHDWFKGIDWNNLRKTPVPSFIPTELDLDQLATNVGHSQVNNQVDDRFHFSEFFNSSPGLSILRNSQYKAPSIDQKNELDEQLNQMPKVWGFTYLPNEPDVFDTSQKDQHVFRSSIKTPANEKEKFTDDRFTTPVRVRSKAEVASTIGIGTATAVRIRRGKDGSERQMSELEEWKELVDHVTMTAKKSGQGGTNIVRLEGRVHKLTESINKLFQKSDEMMIRLGQY
ncbi:hypothetical protein O181_069600 [Austropuccinia psidii MF-1]|uniref:non-specific serine/threonine protein kinase n=1 Tax=Austropuccinia psidii MF-1 TaxID=1389203 RepID=A0A9Q3I887_9BASI|nr:hypothetical protein [Austropuccinia psidii MF-1]